MPAQLCNKASGFVSKNVRVDKNNSILSLTTQEYIYRVLRTVEEVLKKMSILMQNMKMFRKETIIIEDLKELPNVTETI